MLKTKEVVVILNSANIEFYMNKEYDIPKIKNKWGDITTPRGASILVKVEDLSEGAKVLVDVECDGCDTLLEGLKWQTYKKCVKEDGKYYCYKCAHNHYERFISFYQWCYDNLPKELAYYILSRWDYKLNIDKNGRTLSPKDVSFTSNGINRKGYWFKCLEHPEHISEQKRISNFVNENGSIACIQCNTVSITHPYLSLFLVNKEDAYKYSFSSHNELPMKCPRCSHEKKISFNRLTTQGFSCDKCGDGVSFSEKVLFNVFEQLLDKDFQTQLSKTTFEWCKDYKYDFYIKKMNGIICECQGIQHYEETKGNWGSLEDVQENDRDKENLANKNEIENYILLDCRESNLKWIMNSIMNSKLPKLLNFKKSDIDWKICEEFAYSSMIENACNLWNNGDNVVKIADKLKLNRNTITRYLKQGSNIGWCNILYDAKEEQRNHKEYSFKQVICLTTGEIFDNIKEASIKYSIDSSSISKCCRNKLKSCGKMIWEYYDESINYNLLK